MEVEGLLARKELFESYCNLKGMVILCTIERRCIKIAIIFNDRGICGVERSSEFSVSKSNITIILKEW